MQSIGNCLGGIWSQWCQKVIGIRANGQVIGRHEERELVGGAASDVRNGNRGELAKEVWDIPGQNLGCQLTVASCQLKGRQLRQQHGGRWCGLRPSRQGKLRSKYAYAPECQEQSHTE